MSNKRKCLSLEEELRVLRGKTKKKAKISSSESSEGWELVDFGQWSFCFENMQGPLGSEPVGIPRRATILSVFLLLFPVEFVASLLQFHEQEVLCFQSIPSADNIPPFLSQDFKFH